MKLFTLAALFIGTVSSAAVNDAIHGAEIIAADDATGLERIGALHEDHCDRKTVTIRCSDDDQDDIADDFLWGIKKANHGGRLLLKKECTYIIGKKLDLRFLDDIEVQLDGELKVRLY